MRIAPIVILIVVAIVLVTGLLPNPISAARAFATPDDKSFFREYDQNAWPGDNLSPVQFEAAVAHFAEAHVCLLPWRWALIGPNEWLLKGTSYHLVRAADAGVPNWHFSHGYWGGTTIGTLILPEALAKSEVESQASQDCADGVTP